MSKNKVLPEIILQIDSANEFLSTFTWVPLTYNSIIKISQHWQIIFSAYGLVIIISSRAHKQKQHDDMGDVCTQLKYI